MLRLGRSSTSGASGGEFNIAFVNGTIKFHSEEGVLYSRLFHIVDTDADGYIGGTEGAAFIRRARLMNDANREIWRLASGGKSQEKLNKDCWFVAMKLVALVQSTGKCQMQSLYSGDPLPLADFQLEQPVDNVVRLIIVLKLPEETAADFERSFVVSVSTPVVVGSGYSRYTQYVISTKNEMCSHEKLSQTLELQIVLTASTEGLIAGKELLKVASIAATYVPTPASVSSLWSSLKDGVFLSSNVQQVEIKTDDDYARIGQHIDEYEKRIREVTRCSDIVYAAQRGEGYEMSRFGSYLSALSEHEKRDPDMKQLAETRYAQFKYIQHRDYDIKTNMNLSSQLDKLLSMYVSIVRYQAGKVDAVKTVMHNRESAIHEVQQANASMQRNKERFAAARASSGAAASAMRAEQKMASAEDRMNHAKEQVQFIANSLKVETKRMDTGKTANLKTALLSLANLELDYHVQSRAAWEGLRSFLELSDEEIAESRQRAQAPMTYRKPGEKDLGQIIGLL
ncbi:Epidermal growth factor receptor substrate 15 [Phytophthora nicotianae]|uniref:Epidermal growth factor receptor substrate 15 n=1 Tax=Phytophthora nicotianae TaxID=4792 RepID=A0A0W8DCZ9_PHYNI|nr:Epidermal growth factor receptor substrate 15 [Phytophthora nicotianae]KUF94104.1 Epidermal growth factor receptor substrate 15 [Phytophthora nicotianae]